MGDRSAIEWTDATWNPVTGCSKVRFGLTEKPWTAPNAAVNVKLHPERLYEPLKWKKPRRVFVNSMSDLFHEQVPDEFIIQVWETMAGAPHHVFQILTKRPERMMNWVKKYGTHVITGEPALKNVWLGVSVENQKAADERIPLLLQTPAAVRFLSCEPLLGPVDLSAYKPFDGECYCQDRPNGCKPRFAIGCPETAIDWVIVGGESGPHARPMHPDWARSLRDQCQQAGVPFFFKQHGEFSNPSASGIHLNDVGDKPLYQFDDGISVWRVGKKKAGRMLDGRTWDEYPERSV
ncbi:hypothetical protein GCM10025857_33910 [Alicyclobacillus contaminans]|uniref:DUF5131 family protein n=1 Tax=Alicyclobacillus contaminans TaxID=392016 RepID=UPI00047A448E|nr:phage Gp37/Gp68 family protein [Alicyclobacillus contaminans]GMA52034.1 hypothetical protein GCM10025857_33910 [Alicyclobacillus contaminans]